MENDHYLRAFLDNKEIPVSIFDIKILEIGHLNDIVRVRLVRFIPVGSNRTDIFAVLYREAYKIITLVIAVDNSTVDEIIGHLYLIDLLLALDKDNYACNDTK